MTQHYGLSLPTESATYNWCWTNRIFRISGAPGWVYCCIYGRHTKRLVQHVTYALPNADPCSSVGVAPTVTIDASTVVAAARLEGLNKTQKRWLERHIAPVAVVSASESLFVWSASGHLLDSFSRAVSCVLSDARFAAPLARRQPTAVVTPHSRQHPRHHTDHRLRLHAFRPSLPAASPSCLRVRSLLCPSSASSAASCASPRHSSVSPPHSSAYATARWAQWAAGAPSAAAMHSA